MCLRNTSLAAALLTLAAPAGATDYIVGLGIGADDSDGSSLAALVDIGLTEKTFVTLSGGLSDADTLVANIETRSVDVAFSHDFEPVSVRLGFGRWGDTDLIETDDARVGVALDAGGWRFGVDAERRDIELIFQIQPTGPQAGRRITTGVEGDGIGGNVRYRSESGVSVGVRGMTWDYDRNVDGLALFDFVRRINPSTVTLAGALRDSSYTASVDWEVGDHLLGIELGRDELAIGNVEVDSATVLWTIPSSSRTDLELSLGYSEAEGGDGAFYANVFLYFFGGS